MNLEKEFPLSYRVCVKYGDSVTKEIRTRLFNAGKIATEELYDSIGYDLTQVQNGISLKFFMAEYGRYVDKGRKPGGKFPPPKPIAKWMEIKGIEPTALYPIRRKIAEQGIRPTNFFTIPTTRRLKAFTKDLGEAMKLDTQVIIKNEFKKKGKAK